MMSLCLHDLLITSLHVSSNGSTCNKDDKTCLPEDTNFTLLCLTIAPPGHENYSTLKRHLTDC